MQDENYHEDIHLHELTDHLEVYNEDIEKWKKVKDRSVINISEPNF